MTATTRSGSTEFKATKATQKNLQKKWKNWQKKKQMVS